MRKPRKSRPWQGSPGARPKRCWPWPGGLAGRLFSQPCVTHPLLSVRCQRGDEHTAVDCHDRGSRETGSRPVPRTPGNHHQRSQHGQEPDDADTHADDKGLRGLHQPDQQHDRTHEERAGENNSSPPAAVLKKDVDCEPGSSRSNARRSHRACVVHSPRDPCPPYPCSDRNILISGTCIRKRTKAILVASRRGKRSPLRRGRSQPQIGAWM